MWNGSTASCGTRRRPGTGGGVGGRRCGSWCCFWIGAGSKSERSATAGGRNPSRRPGTGHLRRQRQWIELRDGSELVGISEKCRRIPARRGVPRSRRGGWSEKGGSSSVDLLGLVGPSQGTGGGPPLQVQSPP